MFPDWSSYTWAEWVTTDACKVWLMGITTAAIVRIVRAGLKWFRKAGADSPLT